MPDKIAAVRGILAVLPARLSVFVIIGGFWFLGLTLVVLAILTLESISLCGLERESSPAEEPDLKQEEGVGTIRSTA